VEPPSEGECESAGVPPSAIPKDGGVLNSGNYSLSERAVVLLRNSRIPSLPVRIRMSPSDSFGFLFPAVASQNDQNNNKNPNPAKQEEGATHRIIIFILKIIIKRDGIPASQEEKH